MDQRKDKETCTIVIFGATGNLTSLKLFPAIYEIYEQHRQDYNFRVLGFARRDWSNRTLRDVAKRALIQKSDSLPEELEQNIYYIASNFDEDKGYEELKTLIDKDEPTIYYFSVDPTSYFTILRQMRDHGFSSLDTNKRIILEKPFGTNLKTAEELDKKLKSVFQESELYNIDHYLGKEMVQNLYCWREKNASLDKVWNKNLISSIEIILDEQVDVSERPGFYDQTGAMSDMIQNHALQALSMLTANVAESKKESLATAKTKFIQSLKVATYSKDIVRAQYEGYKKHKLAGTQTTLPANTQTETFIAIRLESTLPEWEDVSFFLKTGKALESKRSLAIVHFLGESQPITLEFTLNSDNTPVVTSAHKPEFLTHKAPHTFLEKGEELPAKRALTDYASLIWECLILEKTHFVSLAEIKASWILIDDIRAHFGDTPLLSYSKGSAGPEVISTFLPSA